MSIFSLILARPFRGFVAALFLFALSACAVEPYVYTADEFNRGSSTFKVVPQDISAVTVCYSSRNTTPERVRTLAEQECARFGKQARITKQTFGECPLATPVTATFQCSSGSGYGRPGHQSLGQTPNGAAMRGTTHQTIDWRLPEWFYGPMAGGR